MCYCFWMWTNFKSHSIASLTVSVVFFIHSGSLHSWWLEFHLILVFYLVSFFFFQAVLKNGVISGSGFMNSGNVRCGNSVCRPISGVFAKNPLPNGYVHVTTLPAGASNITITELRNSINFLGKLDFFYHSLLGFMSNREWKNQLKLRQKYFSAKPNLIYTTWNQITRMESQ